MLQLLTKHSLRGIRTAELFFIWANTNLLMCQRNYFKAILRLFKTTFEMENVLLYIVIFKTENLPKDPRDGLEATYYNN